jgi:hypothetical protein
MTLEELNQSHHELLTAKAKFFDALTRVADKLVDVLTEAIAQMARSDAHKR